MVLDEQPILVKAMVFVSLLLSKSFTGFAQIKEDSVRLGYKVSITGTYSRGNVVQTRVLGGLDIHYHSRDHRFGIKQTGTYVYNGVNYRLLQTDLLSTSLFYYKTNPRFFPVGLLWLQTSKLLNYKVVSPGIGLLYVVANKPGNYLSLAGILSQEYKYFNSTNFKEDKYDGLNEFNTARAGLRLHGTQRFSAARVSLQYELYGLQSLRWSDNYRFYMNVAFDVPVYNRFSFRTAFIYSYEKIIIVGRSQNDRSVTFGISYSTI